MSTRAIFLHSTLSQTMTGTGILIGCKRSEYDSSNAFFYSQPDPQLKPGMWLHRFTSRGTKIVKHWGTTSKNLKRLTLCHRHYLVQQSTSIFVYCTKMYYWERTELWLTLAAEISWSQQTEESWSSACDCDELSKDVIYVKFHLLGNKSRMSSLKSYSANVLLNVL